MRTSLNGIEFDPKGCLGCYMVNNPGALGDYLLPIYQDDLVLLTQDVECPVPGFYILSTKKHVSSITELTPEENAHLMDVLYKVRLAMKNILGIDQATLIQEEKEDIGHLHFWLLPVWDAAFNPRVGKNNIYDYIRGFSFAQNKDKILDYNEKMRLFLKGEK
ncbi:MAG: HIT domain-containing protein [Lactobacillales bacterium]|jgi:diadenosine tetraphosphate (Ap4A) HIT family hydrolase|nr:HIT domain-containing protein [Lactobacillales bacterium]